MFNAPFHSKYALQNVNMWITFEMRNFCIKGFCILLGVFRKISNVNMKSCFIVITPW